MQFRTNVNLRTCPECGSELPQGLPKALCPRCALIGALGIPLDTEAPSGSLPQQFGNYELLEEIGRGGMGVVYKARQTQLDRCVAIKLLLFGGHTSPDIIRRFRVEAVAAGSLQHPNIVAIHEVGICDGQHFMAMDFVEGVSLAGLGNGTPLPAARAAIYVRAMAEAIHYAHERGILHRDLKPSNVVIDLNDQPKIMDFGLAQRIEGDSTLTLSGQVLGSPNYIPPEQAKASRGRIGRPSDVYGLGAVLYHLLTGRPPFESASLPQTLHKVLTEDPLAPRVLNHRVPPDLETICLKCLEKEPSRRFQTARDLSDELQRFLDGAPIRSRPAGALERAVRWCKRKPALAASLAIISLLLLAILVGSPLALIKISNERHRAESNLYVAGTRFADQELRNHKLVTARETLERIAQSPRQQRFRGWEWRYLWDRCKGDDAGILGSHNGWVSDLSSSGDGKWLATIGSDGLAKLWDWNLLKEVAAWAAHSPSSHPRPIFERYSIAISPRGDCIATGGANGDIRLWRVSNFDVTGGEIIGTVSASCHGLSFSPDSRFLVAVSLSGQVSVFALSNEGNRLTANWSSGKGLPGDPLFVDGGSSIGIAGYQTPFQVWNLASLPADRPVDSFPGSALPVAFLPASGSILAGVSGQHHLKLWDVRTKRDTQSFQAGSAALTTLVVSPSSRQFAAGAADGTILLWSTNESSPKILAGHSDAVIGLAFSSSGDLLISASLDKTVRLWNPSIDAGSRPARLRHGFSVVGVAFSPDSRYLSSVAREKNPSIPAGEEHTVRLWDLQTLTEAAGAPVGGASMSAETVFSRDGRFVAADDWAGTLGFYRTPSLEVVAKVEGHAAAFHPDGQSVLYICRNRIVKVRLSAKSIFPPDSVIAERDKDFVVMALSPNGRFCAATSETDGGVSIDLWDTARKRLLGTLKGHAGRVHRLVFSSDGRSLFSVGWDGMLGVWSVAQRTNMSLIRAQNDTLLGVAVSGDGKTIATAGSDGVRLWNAETLGHTMTLQAGATFENVSFSNDGRWLAAASNDGSVCLWRAPLFDELARLVADRK